MTHKLVKIGVVSFSFLLTQQPSLRINTVFLVFSSRLKNLCTYFVQCKHVCFLFCFVCTSQDDNKGVRQDLNESTLDLSLSFKAGEGNHDVD